MNRADFQRNFQWSYFGLILTPKVVDFAHAHGIELLYKDHDVHYGDIIPCATPVINAAETFMKVPGIVKLRDGTTGKRTLIVPWAPDIDEDTSFMLAGVPVTGMIQGRHSIWYLSRVPARDTPRGYCPKYTRVTTPNASVLTAHGVDNGEETLIPWKVYNKTYYSWQDAISKIEDGDLVGAALDKFLALGLVQGSPNIQIFYKNKGAVGFVDMGAPYIYTEHATLTIREYVRKIAGYAPQVKAL